MHCSTAIQDNTLQEEINFSWLHGNWDVISIVFPGRAMKLLVTQLLNLLFATCALLLWINCTWHQHSLVKIIES